MDIIAWKCVWCWFSIRNEVCNGWCFMVMEKYGFLFQTITIIVLWEMAKGFYRWNVKELEKEQMIRAQGGKNGRRRKKEKI